MPACASAYPTPMAHLCGVETVRFEIRLCLSLTATTKQRRLIMETETKLHDRESSANPGSESFDSEELSPYAYGGPRCRGN